MAKGTSNALRLEVMNALIQKMPVAQENRFRIFLDHRLLNLILFAGPLNTVLWV